MAFNCSTNSGGEWSSTLTSDAAGSQPVDDGNIEVDTEDATTGDFLGTHFKTGGMIKGNCRAGSGGTCSATAPCHIDFVRRVREGNQTFIFHYYADFKLEGGNFVTINGRYTKRLKPGSVGAAAAEDDGTWVGTKPAT